MSSAEEYYGRAVALVSAIRDDADILAEVAAKATEAIRAGHRVYANVTTGHMPTSELVNEREGNPSLFEFTGHDVCSPEQFAAMRAGDVLLTNHVGNQELEAREAGVYVVVFTTCYFNNRNTPPGEVAPNENDWMPEDVASRVIDSHISWEQGLVHLPQVPEMAVLPGSSNGTCAIHWMITAEVTQALATGVTPDGSRAREYGGILLTRLADAYSRDGERRAQAAAAMADRIIDGGHYYVRSRNDGVKAESNGTAQGLKLVNVFEPRPAQEGGDRDVMLIAAVSVNDPQELSWAEGARANGNLVLGIGPSHNDGLRERCDTYFDDRCAEDAGVLAMPDRDERVCPVTGIANNVIMHVLMAEFVDEMCRRGGVPCFIMGGYRTGHPEYNGPMQELFAERGY